MATIVQPYNPWKEELALTALGKVAGDIIGDIWKSHRQNEQNRKANAFRGQLQENLAQQGNISLTPPEAPKGYNSNPWAYALHQNYSPLTQFDIGTAGVTPKAPTIQDIAQGADSLAATPRFSMLSPELVQGVKNSMMQQAENQRLRDLQDNFANMFRNATTPAEQMRALTEANIYGFGDKAITPLSAFAIHSTPHHTLHEVRTGDQVRMFDYNPFDGQMAERGAYNIGLSPDVREQTAAQREVARTNAAAHQYGYDVTARQNQQELEHKRITDNLTQLDNELKALETEYQNRMQELQGITDKNEAEAYRQRYIEPLITRKNNLLANQSELRNMLWNNMGLSTGNPNNGQNSGATSGGSGQNTGYAKSNDIWFSMVGSPKGIAVHRNGYFGANRGDHTHGGIDIPVAEGTDIRVKPQMGSEFIVRLAENSSTYGNTVILESDRRINGKKVTFRIAHMQNGSLNLKPGQKIRAGDIIGKVGSTGRSSGPHIHLEVMVGNEKINPETFFETFQFDNSAPQPPQTQQQPQHENTQGTQQGQRGNNPPKLTVLPSYPPDVALTNKNGETLTMERINEMAKEQGFSVPDFMEFLRTTQGYMSPAELNTLRTQNNPWELSNDDFRPDMPVYMNNEGRIITLKQFNEYARSKGGENAAIKALEEQGFFPYGDFGLSW